MGGILWNSMLAIVWWMVLTRLLSYGRQSLEPSRRGKKSDKKPYDRSGSAIRNDLFRINNGETGRQHFTQAGNFSRAWTATPQINMPRFPPAKSTVCFYCFEEGHVAPQCPLKIQGRTSMPTATITKEITDKKSA